MNTYRYGHLNKVMPQLSGIVLAFKNVRQYKRLNSAFFGHECTTYNSSHSLRGEGLQYQMNRRLGEETFCINLLPPAGNRTQDRRAQTAQLLY